MVLHFVVAQHAEEASFLWIQRDSAVDAPHYELDDMVRGERIFSFPTLNKDTYNGLPGLLSDSLPDAFGNRIIESWLSSQGRDPKSLTPVERLSYTGKRGMGALEYVPSTYPFDSREIDIELPKLLPMTFIQLTTGIFMY